MTDVIDISTTEKVQVNVVPMQIHYNGEANTQEYFTSSRTTETIGDKKVDVAYFRGCKLVGEAHPLKSHTGYLLNASERLARKDNYENDTYGEEEVITVKTHTPVANFDEIEVFGHDSLVESTNPWALVDGWTNIADILHSESSH